MQTRHTRLFSRLNPKWQKTWPYKSYLVNDEYKFVYCPIPKAACTSLKYWFANTTISPQDTINQKTLHSKLKSKYALACYSTKDAKRIMSDYTKLAFLRDPIARIESGYMHKFVGTDQRTVKKLTIPIIEWVYEHLRNHKVQRTQSFSYRDQSDKEHRLMIDPEIDYEESISFQEFVEYVCTENNQSLNQHWRPQSDFLNGEHFEVIDLADLNTELPRVCHELEIGKAQVPVLNTSRKDKAGRPPRPDLASKTAGELRQISDSIGTLYNQQLKQRVAERYRSDLELLKIKSNTSNQLY